MFKTLFCSHNWEITDQEVEIRDAWDCLIESKVVRFQNCKKCGRHQENTLYYTFKRK